MNFFALVFRLRGTVASLRVVGLVPQHSLELRLAEDGGTVVRVAPATQTPLSRRPSCVAAVARRSTLISTAAGSQAAAGQALRREQFPLGNFCLGFVEPALDRTVGDLVANSCLGVA